MLRDERAPPEYQAFIPCGFAACENDEAWFAQRSTSFSQSQTDPSGTFSHQGGLDATGKQISGIRQDHDQSTTCIPQFGSWSQLSGVNQPTLTEYQAGVGQEVFTSTSDLAFDSEGKATWTFDLSLVSGVASTITSALLGTFFLDPGTGLYRKHLIPLLELPLPILPAIRSPSTIRTSR